MSDWWDDIFDDTESSYTPVSGSYTPTSSDSDDSY